MTPGTARPRPRLGALFGDRLISQNAVLTSGTVVAGLLGLAFHAVISHRLRPGEYAGAATVVSLLGLVGAGAAGTGQVAARSLGRALAAGGEVGPVADLRAGNRLLLGVGMLLGLVAAVTAPWSGAVLQVSPWLVLAAAISMPCALATPFLAGALQGGQRFVELSGFFVSLALMKLALATALGAGGGALGVVAGVTLGTIIAYGLLWLRLREQTGVSSLAPAWREMATYSLVVVPGGAAAGVLLAIDVVMVKALFPPAVAGTYALVAVIGRGVFWGASSVASVLFPRVVTADFHGRKSIGPMFGSLILTAAGGGALVAALAIRGRSVVGAFAGPAYTPAADLLAPYAVGMSLLGLATVLAAAHQARGRSAFLWVLLGVAVGEPLAISLAHHDLRQVVVMVDLAMAVLLTGLAALYVADERRRIMSPGL